MWQENLQRMKNGSVTTDELPRIWLHITGLVAACASLFGVLLVQAIVLSMTVLSLFRARLRRFYPSVSHLKTKMEILRQRLCSFVGGPLQLLRRMKR